MRSAALALLFVGAAALAGAPSAHAQQSFATGQNIAPAYEGWEPNEDGSFNLVLHMNRMAGRFDVPVGRKPIEPAAPIGQADRTFHRANRFAPDRAPADFGDNGAVCADQHGQDERPSTNEADVPTSNQHLSCSQL